MIETTKDGSEGDVEKMSWLGKSTKFPLEWLFKG